MFIVSLVKARISEHFFTSHSLSTLDERKLYIREMYYDRWVSISFPNSRFSRWKAKYLELPYCYLFSRDLIFAIFQKIAKLKTREKEVWRKLTTLYNS